MYTEYFIREQCIHGPEGPSNIRLDGKHFHTPDQGPIGYYLTEGNCSGVQHIYGPLGYTRFYINEGYIFGPEARLPWDFPGQTASHPEAVFTVDPNSL